MDILEWITAIFLTLVVGGIGASKFSSNKDVIEQAQRLGYDKIMKPIGAAEVLGAAGVLLGAAVTNLEWLGSLAAVGIILMMIGAIGYHLRAGDRPENIPAVLVIVASVLYLIALNR